MAESARLVALFEAQERTADRRRRAKASTHQRPKSQSSNRQVPPLESLPFAVLATEPSTPVATLVPWRSNESLQRYADTQDAIQEAREPFHQPRFSTCKRHSYRPYRYDEVQHSGEVGETVRPTADHGGSAAWKVKKTRARGVKYYENQATKARAWQCPDECLPPLTAGTVSTIASRLGPPVSAATPTWMMNHVNLGLALDPTFYLPPDAHQLPRRHELAALRGDPRCLAADARHKRRVIG
jgi:hypothetical protein